MSKPEHLLLVTDAWEPQVNGVVRTLSHTIRYLNNHGTRVTVIHPGQFRTMALPTYREIRLAVFPSRQVRRRIEESGADTIHIATEGPLGWAARRYCLKHKIPFTTSYHTQYPEYVKLRTGLPLSIGYAVMRYFHSPACNVFVATPTMQARLEERGFRHLYSWGRGVDTELFKPHEDGERGDYLKGESPIAVFLGRVAVEKNIRAFLDMPFFGDKVVIGDGPDLQELRQDYPDVVFTGYKTGRELANYLADADVMVFPSKTETFGVVMLEAMACGVPVAAYPVTGPLDVIQNRVNGYVDHNLAVATQNALKCSPQNCIRYAQKYSWKNCTRQFFSGLVCVLPEYMPKNFSSAQVELPQLPD